jgi:hypothetical protein
LKEYDANFDLLSETDLSSIALLDTAYPFAVLDDFLFFARGGHVYLYRLSTLQQVSQLYISAGTNTTVYPTRLLPHPDGALYVQHRYQGADVTQIVTLQWADATFVEDPSEGPDVPEPTPEGTCFDFITNPVNESSLKMQARWDWSDHINAGEWGSETQVYRHRRAYVPLELEDSFNTGYPVIVTRNKVRGRGRSLHLKFTGEEGKDAHLLGYGIRYAVSGRV